MSVLKNLLGSFVPVRERRETSGSIAVANAEIVHYLNGDQSAIVHVQFNSTAVNGTLEFTGSVDGTNYFSVVAYPYTLACAGGTILPAAQPIIAEAINTTGGQRTYCLAVGQLKQLRIRASVWVSGTVTATVISEDAPSMHPLVVAQRAATLVVSATAAVGVAAVATLPAVAGFRHYIDFIRVRRSATAALTAAAAPVVTTQANLPGAVAMTFGQDAGGIGIDKDEVIDFGASGLAAVAINTVSSITCPAYAGVIWRINVAYRLGL